MLIETSQQQSRSQKIVQREINISLELCTQQNNFSRMKTLWGFPGGAVVENLPANAGDTGSSPGLGRSHMPRSSWAREPQLLSLRSRACAPQQERPR